jgi:hypothetical protein
MTFSEFGRRIKSNSSAGTDHGAAAPLFVFGESVQAGVLGTNPIINSLVNTADNIPMQYDFRSIYSTILESWFCVPGTSLQNVMLKNFQSLPIIKTSDACAGSLSNYRDAGENLISNYPNPFTTTTKITYKSAGGHVLVQVFDVQGKIIATLVDEVKLVGDHSINFDSTGLQSGLYYARLQNGTLQQVRNMLMAK